MQQEDLPAAHGLSSAVGWPHRLEDWAFNFSLGLGFVVEEEGRVLGTILGWPFGTGATIGLVIVAEEAQGRGFGRMLTERMMAALGDGCLMLNATVPGRPLYAKLGFTETGRRIEQHQGTPFSVGLVPPPPGDRLRPLGRSDAGALAALDRQATGLDRRALLEALLEVSEGVVLDRGGEAVGFALMRRFGRGHVVGPVIAPDAEAAKVLIGYWLGYRSDQFIRVDVQDDSGLGPWLDTLGLSNVGSVVSMIRGTAPDRPGPAQRFALTNQALG
ncbi:GNAT family N-acetyltransferase [Acetobacteraceae bacterium H6797]|nr:GNAT family N-acetyltransferase [Acetobacteraceae bacterium H6797]